MSRRRKGTSEPRGLQVAQAKFGSVLDGSTNKTVDPRACLPLTRIRRYSRSGILRLKRIFSGQTGALSGTTVVGFVAGSDCPIVIPLVGTYSRIVIDFFVNEEGLTEDEAEIRMKSREVFYGVVDGMHRILALLELIDEQPEKWDGFSLPVTVLKGGHDIQTLKQLARQQNKKHSQAHYVETTLYDHLRGLKDEAANLSNASNGRRPSGREVAEAYDGPSYYKDQTMLQMANTAMRLSDKVLEVLGEIMSSEHPDLVDIPAELSHALKLGDKETIMGTVDCRVYRKFINLTSLKSATAFMKGGDADAVEAQVNTMYRCREICRSQGFKAVPYRTVVEQYERASQAVKECRKMEALMETAKWPLEMQTLQANVLRSTKFDADIVSNAGNDTHILPVLLKHYENVCPGISTTKIQKYNFLHRESLNPTSDVDVVEKDSGDRDNVEQQVSASITVTDMEKEHGCAKETNNPDSDLPQTREKEKIYKNAGEVTEMPDDNEENGAAPSNESEDAMVGGTQLQPSEMETPGQSEGLESQTEVADGDNLREGIDLLKSMGFSTHQMRWQEYDETVKADNSELFDILLTDPPYGLPGNRSKSGTRYNDFVDEKEMRQLAEFARRSLIPGGYVFLFCSHSYFQYWLEAFQGTAFRCMKYPFVIHKDGNTMQGHRNEEFPQNNCEYALIARAPNAGSNAFKPDFTSPFHSIPCKQKRRFASLVNCPVPRSKLTNGQTKSPLLTEEKNPKVLVEVLQTFSREGARVLDCYGGTLTTVIACIMSRRKCCVIEKDAELFDFAIHRLLRMVKTPEGAQDGKRQRLCVNSRQHGNANDEARSSAGEGLAYTGSETIRSRGEAEIGAGLSPCIENLQGGDDVWLKLTNRRVATAKLQWSTNSENHLTLRIHGHDLRLHESENEFLVAVLDVCVEEDEIETIYPYSFKSLDEIPKVLGEMVKGGIYAWDLKCIEPRVSGH